MSELNVSIDYLKLAQYLNMTKYHLKKKNILLCRMYVNKMEEVLDKAAVKSKIKPETVIKIMDG